MPRSSARRLVLAVLLVSVAAPLRAQVVTGRLMDASANRPIAAAFIQLLDSTGVRRAGALTDSAGRFVLSAQQPGAYQLRAERLGYESETSPLLRLGETPVSYVFALDPRALVLPAVAARSQNTRGCERRPDGPAVYALWNAVHTALSVTSWSSETGALRYSMINYERELDRALRNVKREERTPFYAAAALPYRAHDPEDLARDGYFIAEDSTYWLLGLDADVLLSESFLNMHCFRLVSAPDTTVVGLGFEPLRRDDRTDVSGVLWVDRGTAELKYLAFEYENLPVPLRRFGAAGEVHFRRLDNGLWIVDRWWIRSPLFGRPRSRLTGYRENGGTVTSAAAIDTELFDARGRGVIEGLVLDAGSSAPLEHALVFLSGTPFSAVTSTTGRYYMQHVPEGRYEIGFTHPVLEELGVPLPFDSVTVTEVEPLRLTFTAPALPSILRTLCPGVAEERTTGLVYGVVRSESNGDPLAGIEVRASWRGPPPSGGGRDVDRVRATHTRPDGRYFLCWVPTDRDLELRVDTRLVRHRSVNVNLSDAPRLRRDFD